MNAERFRNAIVEIEQLLRKEAKLPADDRTDLKALIDNSRLLNKQHKDKLNQWRQLRNVIVHTSSASSVGFKYIADPRDSEVLEIEKLVEILRNPPQAAKVLGLKPPKVLDWNSDISMFFQEVKSPNNFSQAPYRDRKNEYRLITSNAVARFVADVYKNSLGAVIEQTTIEKVDEYCEEGDGLTIARKDISAQDTINILTSPRNIPPAAVLLTDTGHQSGKVLGLVVRADLPVLYRAISL